MQVGLSAGSSRTDQPAWQELVARYQTPDLRRSLWQVANTFVPFFGLLGLMYVCLAYTYWLTLALAIPTGGLLIRIFIILHDCGHGSFFPSKRANNLLGTFCGLLTFVPYGQWRYAHALHHATSSDLDRRGAGDIIMWTVDEYLGRPRWQRLLYRIYRHPIFMLFIGPPMLLLITQRLTNPTSRQRERRAVYLTNIALLLVVVVMALTIGLKVYMMLYLPVLLVAGVSMCYGFYVQHQFEGVAWNRHEEWDYVTASLQGSSYLKFPRVLQWFTGNIGFHHVHHLSPRIPNYNLQRCHDENSFLQQVTTITFWSGLKSLRFGLWDEEQSQLITFKQLRTIRKQRRLVFLEGDSK